MMHTILNHLSSYYLSQTFKYMLSRWCHLRAHPSVVLCAQSNRLHQDQCRLMSTISLRVTQVLLATSSLVESTGDDIGAGIIERGGVLRLAQVGHVWSEWVEHGCWRDVGRVARHRVLGFHTDNAQNLTARYCLSTSFIPRT
jgi:hypothetical protein